MNSLPLAIGLGIAVLVSAGGGYAVLYWLFRHDGDDETPPS